MSNVGSFILGSIVSSIIFLSIYSIWANPDIITDRIGSIKSSVKFNNLSFQKGAVSKDPLVVLSIQSFDECASRTREKYGASIRMIEAEKFDSKQDAEEFYDNWKGYSQSWFTEEMISKPTYPLVLIAAKISNQGQQTPVVVVFNDKGELTSLSKSILLC